ncbi:hypothetical protein ONS96_006829 [Cadophora gregata f. sp. sojae]|nr:hypothetical protein ONS96_006829 [Cadophora gregata f. sp. sojae]
MFRIRNVTLTKTIACMVSLFLPFLIQGIFVVFIDFQAIGPVRLSEKLARHSHIMPPKGAKKTVKTRKGKGSGRRSSDEPMQTDDETPAPKRSARDRKRKEPVEHLEDEPGDSDEDRSTKRRKKDGTEKSKEKGKGKATEKRKPTRTGKVPKKSSAAEEAEQKDDDGEDETPGSKDTQKEEEHTGPGIRVRSTLAGSAPVRLDSKAQALRSSRKGQNSEGDKAQPFPKYGKETDTEQTKKFFSTISTQVARTENRRGGHYPLASSMPANRGKTWDAIVIHRTCAVCGVLFHQGGADGQYTEHMRLYHPRAPRSNRHGLPRVPHQSLITQGRVIPGEAWEAIARADAESRALFAALPGAERFYTREQVRPNNVKEFVASGDNPPPRGGHPFFPWDMDKLSRDNKPPPPPPLRPNTFCISIKWRKDFHKLEETIEQYTSQLDESEVAKKQKGKGKGKAKATEEQVSEDEDAVDPEFARAMEALEAVIKFFIGEAKKYKNDKSRLEYTFRNLHLIMYQARVGFAAKLPELAGEPDYVREA